MIVHLRISSICAIILCCEKAKQIWLIYWVLCFQGRAGCVHHRAGFVSSACTTPKATFGAYRWLNSGPTSKALASYWDSIERTKSVTDEIALRPVTGIEG